jgi:hypothetical protein
MLVSIESGVENRRWRLAGYFIIYVVPIAESNGSGLPALSLFPPYVTDQIGNSRLWAKLRNREDACKNFRGNGGDPALPDTQCS